MLANVRLIVTRRFNLLLTLILLLGFGLRLYRLSEQNIWWDEGHAVWAARQSLAQTTRITAQDVHPPLYLWMLHGWLRLVGTGELAVRYLSLIGGLLTVALVGVLARRLFGRPAALLASLLTATARFHIWWSQEARMYVWAAFFALLSVYLFSRLRHNRNSGWSRYILSSAAALYTLYLAGLTLILENLFMACTLWRQPERRRLAFRWVLSQLGIAALYAPWLIWGMSRTRTDVARSAFPFHIIWQLYGTVLISGVSTDLHRYVWLTAAFALLILVGLIEMIRDRTQPQRYGFVSWEIALLLGLPLVLPPLVVYALSIPRGFFYSPKPEARYLLLFAPLFYILLAGLIVQLTQRHGWRRVVGLGMTALTLITWAVALPIHYSERYLRDDYQTAMRTLAAYGQPDDAVLLVSGDRYPVFLYHYNRQFPNDDGPTVYLMPRRQSLFTADNVEDELRPLHEQHGRLWLAAFERSLQDPQNLVESWLAANRQATLRVWQGYNSLTLYTAQEIVPTVRPDFRPQYAVDHSFANGDLIGYDQVTDEFRPGDVMQTSLYIRSAGGDWTARWLDAQGEVIDEQRLLLSLLDTAAMRRVLAPLAVYTYTPPGRCRLQVCQSDGQNCVTLPAGQITHSRNLPAGRPDVSHRVKMGNGIVLFLGYTARPRTTVRAGQSLTLELHWQGQQWLEQDYTVFAHLLGPYNPATGGPLWAQDDGQPLREGHPTTRWRPGEVVIDTRVLDVLPQTPPGVYQIEIGLYDALTGERMSVSGDEANRILLADVRVQE